MQSYRAIALICAGLLTMGSPAFAATNKSTLPRPDLRGELMAVDGFRMTKTQFPESTRIAIFFYSAAWCPYCKITSNKLKEVYPSLKAQYPEIELVSFAIDNSISERATYLRDAQPAWPAISPAAREKDEWTIPLPQAIPQLQAFTIESDCLVPLTPPGPADQVLQAAIEFIKPAR
jgi:glutaredoxin